MPRCGEYSFKMVIPGHPPNPQIMISVRMVKNQHCHLASWRFYAH